MAVSINGTSGVSGVDGSAGTPALQGSDTNTGISFGTDEVAINTGGTERVKVDSSGNVGVGTTSPAQLLHLSSTGFPAIRVTDADNSTYFDITNSDGDIILKADEGNAQASSAIRFNIDSTERMRIASGGLVYAGTTTADGSAHIFATSAPSSFAFKIHNTNSNNAVPTRGLKIKYDLSPNDTNNAIELEVGSGSPFVVRNNGNVQNTNGSFTAFSDARYKENIVDASSQWEDIKNTRIRNWNFRSELGWATHTMLGPVAQELELVSPGLVDDNPVIDEYGNDTGEVQKSVNQSVLYMKAVKALQEAMERIETLEGKVAALEGGAS